MKARYFDSHFNAINTEIAFDASWCNGTGYFDNATRAVKLQPGKLGVSKDPHGRKIILVGTRHGTCVFFERYSRESEVQEQIVVVSNAPSALRCLITDGNIGYDEFSRLVTNHINIGTALEDMYRILEKTQKSLAEEGL